MIKDRDDSYYRIANSILDIHDLQSLVANFRHNHNSRKDITQAITQRYAVNLDDLDAILDQDKDQDRNVA